MKMISNVIYEDIKLVPNKSRKTVRGIIINEDNEVLLLYSKKFNDYTFPGGGLKEDEDHVEALSRELREEIGAKIVKVLDSVGYIDEIRYGISGSNSVYKQRSYYYLCMIGDIAKPNYQKRELDQGLEAKWVKIDDAINHNSIVLKDNLHQANGLKTVLLREEKVLKYIKKELLK